MDRGARKPIQFGEAAASGAHLLTIRDGRRAIRVGEDYKSRKKIRKMEFLLCPNKMSRLWKHSMARQGKFNNRKVKRTSLAPSQDNSTMVGQKANKAAKQRYQSKDPEFKNYGERGIKFKFPSILRGRSLYLIGRFDCQKEN